LSAHEKSFQQDFVEFGVGSSGEESVEFDEHVKVEIVALGGLPSDLSVSGSPHTSMRNINSHFWVFYVVFSKTKSRKSLKSEFLANFFGYRLK
jgi:hypothetical protein